MMFGIPWIDNRKKFTGQEVRKLISVYKKEYHKLKKKNYQLKQTIKRQIRVKKENTKKNSLKLKLKYQNLASQRRTLLKLKQSCKNQIAENKKKLQEFIKNEKKNIRKEERTKMKYRYVDENENTNPRNYDIITWIRIYAKIKTATERTKLKDIQLLTLLWINAQKEGEATGPLWEKDTNIGRTRFYTCCRRMSEFALVKSTTVKNRTIYSLTERGNNFVKPIIQYIKKDTPNAKRVKRQFVRNNVQVPIAATGIHDGEQQVRQEGAVL